MKTMILSLIALTSLSALATTELFECTTGYNNTYQIEVDYQASKSRVFFVTPRTGERTLLKGKTTTAIAQDDGPVFVSFQAKQPKINWQRNECFRFGNPNLSFTMYSQPGVKSEFENGPVMLRKPNTPNCSFPQIHPAQPQKITCRIL